MISIETARQLKEAGLEWEPKIGDWYHVVRFDGTVVDNPSLVTDCTCWPGDEDIWSPRLDQLLANARDRGYEIGLLPAYLAVVYQLDESEEGWLWLYEVEREKPDEAAAQALLWILGKEGMR